MVSLLNGRIGVTLWVMLGVLLIGALLGGRRGGAAMLVHLAQGLAGVGGDPGQYDVINGGSTLHLAGTANVNAMTVGIAPSDRIFYAAAAGVGNPLVYVGSKTGRDGIHGATMASAEFDDASEEKRPTVQVGDPFMGKLLLAFTIFFYVVIYTMWLKRWTAQNIVIGGAAGALPPVVAWAAATGSVAAGAAAGVPAGSVSERSKPGEVTLPPSSHCATSASDRPMRRRV